MKRNMLTITLIVLLLTPFIFIHAETSHRSPTDSITIGAGNQTAHIPLDFFNQSSIFQTILMDHELESFIGLISSICFYNNFNSAITNTPVKIWLGSTERDNLDEGWISANHMELVFDGNFDFPAGENEVCIEFDEPYLRLDTDNLALLVQRPLDTQFYHPVSFFKCQTIGSNRSRKAFSNIEQYDPADMSGGSLSGQFPKITLNVIYDGVSHIEGIVLDEDGAPLQDVEITLSYNETIYSDSDGSFCYQNLLPGDYQLSLELFGYLSQEHDLEIIAGETLEPEFTLISIPEVSVFGRIIASDTDSGLAGVNIRLTGYQNYSAISDAAGDFSLPEVYGLNDYEYVISAAGYSTVFGEIEIIDEGINMGDIVLAELAFAPTGLTAEISPDHLKVILNWTAPDPDAFEINESFEGGSFPPPGWGRTITNHGTANMHGVLPTWCMFGNAEGVYPSDGEFQAGLAWIAEHQDEWLFTPYFTCPPEAYLRFDTHLQYGSDSGDHYYVKITNDGGENWQILWDGAAEDPGLNNYQSPVVIDLSAYAGMNTQIAWHADDGPEQAGMWHNWYIDNVYLGNFAPSRAHIAYEVWRFDSEDEDDESNWELIDEIDSPNESYEDHGWASLPEGSYTWAIKAIYDAEIASVPAISNSLLKEDLSGTASGFVRNILNDEAIVGATISLGDEELTQTTANGFYNISLPAGMHVITASHPQYTSASDELLVVPGENSSLNFMLKPVSNEDITELIATELYHNYPNPFNPQTTISYGIKEPVHVRLEVFNLKGQLVQSLVDETRSAGRHEEVFSAVDDKGNKLSSGLYFYRLRAGDFVQTKKMMLLE